jgi:hypothetical protein
MPKFLSTTEQRAALYAAAGQAFYNTSKFTLRDLKSRGSQQQLLADFEDYLNGFSPKEVIVRYVYTRYCSCHLLVLVHLSYRAAIMSLVHPCH